MNEERIRELFNLALDVAAADRVSFLDRHCGDDAAIRAEVESLLSNHLTELANPVDESWQLRGGDHIGPYKILSMLGEGGFGVVYLAEQSSPIKRRVALKVLKPGMDSRQVIARFEAERQALAIMNHPFVATVHDAGLTEQGRPYFAMEYVKGVPITDAADKQRLKIDDRLQLMAKVCDAIHHAHTKGVIHRDIKPGNVLVQINEIGELTPKVIDFGVAKATTQQLTEMTLVTAIGQIVGTPAYMSPEQADLRGTDIDTRSDIYALGVVLYELLVGCPPFSSEDLSSGGLDEMKRIICESPPPRPSDRLTSLSVDVSEEIAGSRRTASSALAGTLKRELEWIPLKAIRKLRHERYDSALHMAADIRRYLAGEPLEAGPETGIYRLRKSIRRNRVAWLVAALVTFVLASTSTVSLVLWQEAVRQAEISENLVGELDRSQLTLAVTGTHMSTRTVHELKFHHPDTWSTLFKQSISGIVNATPDDPTTRIEMLAKLSHDELWPTEIIAPVADELRIAWRAAKAHPAISGPGSDDIYSATVGGRLALANLKITYQLMRGGGMVLDDVEDAQRAIPQKYERAYAEGFFIFGCALRANHQNERAITTLDKALVLLERLPVTERSQLLVKQKLLECYNANDDYDVDFKWKFVEDKILPAMGKLYLGDDMRIREYENYLINQMPEDKFSEERASSVKKYIEEFRVAYGSNNNVVWVEMQNAAEFFFRYAEFLRRNGDADSAAEHERYAARLWDDILLSAMKHRPDDMDGWAYRDHYVNRLPEDAPDKKEWEEFKQNMSTVPWREAHSE